MLKANTKKVFSILIPLSLAFFVGCSGPEEKRAAGLDEVAQLRSAGENANALASLETLALSYPNDTEILRQIGTIHEALGNTVEAAFYLSAAYAQAPDDLELLYQTYRAQENADQPTAAHELLETLAATDPDAMNQALWLRLGGLRAKAQQTQSALDAYLKGVDPKNSPPSAETAAAISTLFKQLDNLPQAERWFNQAANSDDPNALPALFGLLEIQLRNKNWAEAETMIAQLDQQFPGALDASEWANARGELERWRNAQTAMQAELAKTKAAEAAAIKAAAEAEAAAELAATKAAQAAKAAKAANEAKQAAAQAAKQASTQFVSETSSTAANETTSGKAQIIADMEHAEAMANAPAVEALEAPGKENAIAFDPSIAIQPAEPALGFDVSYDQQSTGANTDYSVGHSDLNDSIAPDVVIEAGAESNVTIRPTLAPRSLKQLLAEAESASLEHDYKGAIQLYWQALGRANNRADIWNQLSRAYRIDGQAKNAETTALEATRLAPQEIDYTLDYLRVIQRTKKPEDFLAEVATAYDRFPQSPEIALSLARAYERISGNKSAAITLYQRFIELAPNHPLRPEAEASISRLR